MRSIHWSLQSFLAFGEGFLTRSEARNRGWGRQKPRSNQALLTPTYQARAKLSPRHTAFSLEEEALLIWDMGAGEVAEFLLFPPTPWTAEDWGMQQAPRASQSKGSVSAAGPSLAEVGSCSMGLLRGKHLPWGMLALKKPSGMGQEQRSRGPGSQHDAELFFRAPEPTETTTLFPRETCPSFEVTTSPLKEGSFYGKDNCSSLHWGEGIKGKQPPEHLFCG